MKLTYTFLPITKMYALHVDGIPWAARNTLVELVVIADGIYKFGAVHGFTYADKVLGTK